MARLKNICSRGMAVLFLGPGRGLKSQAGRALAALCSSTRKPTRAASKVWRLSSARLPRRLDQLRQVRAPHRADATLGPRWPGHLRDFLKRFRPLGAEPKRRRAWAVDARGFWVMHQEADARKREAEQTKQVDAPSTIETEHETLVGAAEKDPRKVRRPGNPGSLISFEPSCVGVVLSSRTALEGLDWFQPWLPSGISFSKYRS